LNKQGNSDAQKAQPTKHPQGVGATAKIFGAGGGKGKAKAAPQLSAFPASLRRDFDSLADGRVFGNTADDGTTGDANTGDGNEVDGATDDGGDDGSAANASAADASAASAGTVDRRHMREVSDISPAELMARLEQLGNPDTKASRSPS
jgi:hypothetical protein